MADVTYAHPLEANDNAPDHSAVRPKVMRRPAHFTGQSSVTEFSTALPAISPSIPAAHPPRDWQDDGRFGAAMLALVILINLGLMVGLPHLRHSITESAQANESIHVVMAPPVPLEQAKVTLYSQPEADRRIIHMLDLRQISSVQNSLSVSPKDIPAPTARPLDAPPREDDDTDSMQ